MSNVELKLKMDKKYLDELKDIIGTNSNDVVFQNALATLKWAAQERQNDRYVVSANAEGEEIHPLNLSILNRLAKKAVK